MNFFFQSIFVCVAILMSTSYWSVRVTSFHFKLNGGLSFPKIVCRELKKRLKIIIMGHRDSFSLLMKHIFELRRNIKYMKDPHSYLRNLSSCKKIIFTASSCLDRKLHPHLRCHEFESRSNIDVFTGFLFVVA